MGIDLDEDGIAVVPIFGTHFSSYAKLFGPGGIQKKCAILTDGDLLPSDADPDSPAEQDEVSPALSRQELNALRGPYVEVFTCETTFERELTLHGTLAMLEAGTREIGAPRLANTLRQLQEQITAGEQPDLTQAKDRVLRTAKRFGKARYAQVISKHATSARAVPDYLRNALEWLNTDAPNE
jgi:putative ATP-dependent endonuclease of OLD family